jgi:hypothetical protein
MLSELITHLFTKLRDLKHKSATSFQNTIAEAKAKYNKAEYKNNVTIFNKYTFSKDKRKLISDDRPNYMREDFNLAELVEYAIDGRGVSFKLFKTLYLHNFFVNNFQKLIIVYFVGRFVKTK